MQLVTANVVTPHTFDRNTSLNLW